MLVLGSQNSSNSRRLVELVHETGVKAYLIDGPGEIRPDWFKGDENVVVTAGASAPEAVVEQCLDYLRDKYGAEIETRVVREEDVYFPLPRELRGVPDARLEANALFSGGPK